MKFWLILKQSVRGFYNKLGLYVTFTIFLVIALSLVVGLFGFSYSLDQNIRNSVGRIGLNQNYDFSSTYVPTWVIDEYGNGDPEKVAQDLDKSHYYERREIAYEITDFFQKEFLPPQFKDVELDNLTRLLTLGIGYSRGSVLRTMQENDVYNNPLLYHYFSTLIIDNYHYDEEDNIKQNLKIYNDNRELNYPIFARNHFTNNLVAAVFLQKFAPSKGNISNYNLASGNQITANIFKSDQYENPNFKYQRLDKKSNLVKYQPQLIDSTPWLLFSNEANPFNIIEELSVNNLSAYDSYLKDFRYTYVPPKFLKQNHLKLGDKINFYYNKSPDNIIEFVIIGTMAENFEFNDGANPNFTMPYQWALNYKWSTSENALSLAEYLTPFDKNVKLYNSQYKNSPILAQQAAANLISNYFSSLRTEDFNNFYQQITSTSWMKDQLSNSYNLVITLFYTLSVVLSILIIVLLFVVFYFITREIINLEKNSLLYLKAIGVYNSNLSLLITFSLLFPILIGIIGGLFGALGIQSMIFNIATDPTVLTFNFFTFNFPFLLTFLLSILIILVGFYLINFRFLRSPSLLHPENKTPGFMAKGLIKTKTKMDNWLSREVRITLAFAFKNIYKNIVTFFILAITFGAILYIVQFQSSLTSIAGAYERWNAPYQSVLYQPRLSPIISESPNYEQSYEVINENQLGDLTPINNRIDLTYAIKTYLSSLDLKKVNDEPFNWNHYYLTNTFTKSLLEFMGPNPSDKQINEWLDLLREEIREKTGDKDFEIEYQARGQIINIVQQVTSQNNSLKEQFNYNDGYNIFFGKLITPKTSPTRNVLSLRTNYQSSADNLIAKSIFFENDASSRAHYGFNNATQASSYIQKGIYSVLQGSGKLIRVKDPLRVAISSYLQTNRPVHVGDVVPLRVDGLKTDEAFDGYLNDESALIYGYVSHIVRDDTIQNTFFSSQIGLLDYLGLGKHEILEDDNNQNSELPIFSLEDQEVYYQTLLKALEDNQTTLSNSVFTADSKIPFGLRNITLPFYTHTDTNKEIGSRIEDFYSSRGLFQRYLNSFQSNIMIFSLVTENLKTKTSQFTSILWRFVIILTILALIISLLLVTLVLLENRQIISVLKALGYRRSEITGYLITGYLFATILALLASIGLSFLAFFLTKKPIAQYLGMSVYYLFSWEFFLLAFFLGVFFVGIMAISIAIFTRYQNPKNAFVSA